MTALRVCLIVAVAENGVIGRDGALPWRIPEDLQHFKRTTLGKPIIMGRKTWESIGKPLPGRTNIVVTRQKDFRAPGATVVADLAAAYEAAELSGAEEAMVIGGAEIYAAALDDAACIHLTEVHTAPEGDTTFEFDRTAWRQVAREDHAGVEGRPAYSFVTLERA